MAMICFAKRGMVVLILFKCFISLIIACLRARVCVCVVVDVRN